MTASLPDRAGPAFVALLLVGLVLLPGPATAVTEDESSPLWPTTPELLLGAGVVLVLAALVAVVVVLVVRSVRRGRRDGTS